MWPQAAAIAADCEGLATSAETVDSVLNAHPDGSHHLHLVGSLMEPNRRLTYLPASCVHQTLLDKAEYALGAPVALNQTQATHAV